MGIKENDIVFGRSGLRYTLGKEVGAGGEGRVFRVVGQPLVGKIYKKVDPETVKKIQYMAANPISNLSDDYGNPVLTLAWPQDTLYDSNGAFIGYVMPFIGNGVEICTVARGCDMPAAQKLFPNYNRMVNLRVAVNLARSVAYLHQCNCIIGDLNCKNIMVGSDCSITILDNDSFDLLDPFSGEHFRCSAGTQDYLAPELQGRSLRSPNAIFSTFSDDFSLAIHVFQLLMNNFHPFTGKNLVVIRNSTSVNQRLEHLATGKCPFIHNYSDLTIPVGAPILEEMMPAQLVNDFYQTFDYNASNIRERMPVRTTAAQWYSHLKMYLNQLNRPGELVRCPQDSKHYYLRSIGKCGLCCADQRLNAFRNQARTQQTASMGTAPKAAYQYSPPNPQQPVNQYHQPHVQQAASQGVPAQTISHSSLSGLMKKVLMGAAAFVAVSLIIASLYTPSTAPAEAQSNQGFQSPTETNPQSLSGDTHQHSWQPATYSSPEQCSACGATRGSVKGYIGSIPLTWEEMKIGVANCGMFHMEPAIYGLRKMTVSVDIQMKHGAYCKDWIVKVWQDGQWVDRASIYLPDGNGYGAVTITGNGTEQIEYFAIVPNKSGGYSWDYCGYWVTDAQGN